MALAPSGGVTGLPLARGEAGRAQQGEDEGGHRWP